MKTITRLSVFIVTVSVLLVLPLIASARVPVANYGDPCPRSWQGGEFWDALAGKGGCDAYGGAASRDYSPSGDGWGDPSSQDDEEDLSDGEEIPEGNLLVIVCAGIGMKRMEAAIAMETCNGKQDDFYVACEGDQSAKECRSLKASALESCTEAARLASGAADLEDEWKACNEAIEGSSDDGSI